MVWSSYSLANFAAAYIQFITVGTFHANDVFVKELLRSGASSVLVLYAVENGTWPASDCFL